MLRSITNSFENKKTGKRKWLTKKQMLPFFDNDESIVDGIILRKTTDSELSTTEVREHPETGDVYQYLVLIEDEEKATESDKILDRFRMKQSTGDQGDSDSAESDDDDDSSDDDDDEEATKAKGSKSKDGAKKKKKKASLIFSCVCVL